MRLGFFVCSRSSLRLARCVPPILAGVTGAVVIAACSSSSPPASSQGTTSSSKASSGSSSSGGHGGAGGGDAGSDATYDAPIVPPPDGSILDPCSLPGSLQFTGNGPPVLVKGGSPSWPDLSFLTLPKGYCAHYFATVPNARQLRFAPGGELFVASPTNGTTGGGPGGLDSIVLLPDDNQDGVADGITKFLSFQAPSTTQGLLFTPGYFYYQDGNLPGTAILRMPYVTGQRAPSAAGEVVADITVHMDALHWPKTLDMADDGSIYVGNGGGQQDGCVEPHPFLGGIMKIDAEPGGPNPNGQEWAQGFRNPINIRCRPGKNTCFALELAKDYTFGVAQEKMVPITKGDDWGFPCCATTNLPYPQTQTQSGGTPNCSGVAKESNGFFIGDTPFGMDFEAGHWVSPWTNRAFVVLHGQAGTNVGARLVAIEMNTTTGVPMPSSDNDAGMNTPTMTDFATGWSVMCPGNPPYPCGPYGRPAAITFHPDGRLFLANDNNGIIIWIGQMMQ